MRLAVFVGYHYCELAPSAINRVKKQGGHRPVALCQCTEREE